MEVMKRCSFAREESKKPDSRQRGDKVKAL